MCSRDSGSRPLCPWNPHPNRLYALCLALVIFSSTLFWILCFIVVEELFQKRILKQILSLPMSCPDPAVYILTGILPIEAQIHIKSLTFFNNVCHQGEKNTEKRLARRQLTVKEESSNSWFICVNKIPVLRKYDLKEAYNYLDNPIKKSRWISLVKSRVIDHWCTQLTTLAQLYKGLQYLSNHNLSKCKGSVSFL
jgi:hypothetical protein